MANWKRASFMMMATILLTAWVHTAAFAVDYTAALKLWHQQADQGDAKAQKSIGDSYANGWGVTQNYTEAMNWYRKAANQNYADAQFQIGEMYEYGRGMKQDSAQAYMWYSLAVAAGGQFVDGRLKILAEKMTPQEIAEGKRLASEWKPAASTAKLISPAAQACTPSGSDFKALAASPSRLTPSAYSTLTPAQQKSVCDTRAFLKEVDAQKGAINKIGSYSTKYLSPAENDRIVDASNDYLARLLKSKGL
jgi:hypothetical protein